MKIATWNVNSLTARHQHVLDWLAAQPVDAPVDVLCLQELKMTDDKFPLEALAAAGYPHCAVFGQKTYNGVAIVSRHPLTEVTCNIKGFADEQSRVIAATVSAPDGEALRVINGYFVNGQEPGSEKFIYKMAWLGALHRYVAAEMALHPRLEFAENLTNLPRQHILVFRRKAVDGPAGTAEGAAPSTAPAPAASAVVDPRAP